MRAALVTILPMLAAAILVMAGGERLARRETETRIPTDRPRLLDLADAFRAELVRLDGVYEGHLERIAAHGVSGKPDVVEAAGRSVVGTRLIRILRMRGKDEAIPLSQNAAQLPEVELEGKKRPLDEKRALVLPARMPEQGVLPSERWKQTTAPGTFAYCTLAEPGTLVVILVDIGSVLEKTNEHLMAWAGSPMTPLREAGERVQIEGPAGLALASTGKERHGPAASIIPVRGFSGVWQIRAWDGLTVHHGHDMATLGVAGVIALILAGSGFVLYFQQKRALRLAAERVSFVNRVSHELGTPLTNLSLNLDLATEALASRPAEARKRLGLVAEEIERLSRLVANVLTFSRKEKDTLKLKPARCVAGEVVTRTLDAFRPSLERRGIQVHASVRAEAPVLLDADALSQVTGNLISNVEKYASTGGWMELKCVLESDSLVLTVDDRGPGIPEKARMKVFVPFERVTDATNEGASGTGLGLSIGRDLAMRMGGTLELLETPAGACFRLRVPAPPALAIVSNHTDAA